MNAYHRQGQELFTCIGCPFKHWDEDHIQQMLVSHGMAHKNIRQVTSYLQDHHYQLACQKYFEILHGVRAYRSHHYGF